MILQILSVLFQVVFSILCGIAHSIVQNFPLLYKIYTYIRPIGWGTILMVALGIPLILYTCFKICKFLCKHKIYK